MVCKCTDLNVNYFRMSNYSLSNARNVEHTSDMMRLADHLIKHKKHLKTQPPL